MFSVEKSVELKRLPFAIASRWKYLGRRRRYGIRGTYIKVPKVDRRSKLRMPGCLYGRMAAS